MKIETVKDLKEFLATLPEEADKWPINFFGEEGGLTEIGEASEAHWDEDADNIPEGYEPGSPFLVLSCQQSEKGTLTPPSRRN